VVATRLIGLKRIDHMIRAFRIAHDRHPGAQFHIWGDGVERQRLEHLARSLGLEQCVVFHGHTSKPHAALATGSVALSTSTSEGFGLSTQEALALGVPVISYDYRYGPSDLIEDGRTGRLVSNGDVEALGEALGDALAHPVRTRVWGVRAWWAQRNYRAAVVRSRWLDLISGIEA